MKQINLYNDVPFNQIHSINSLYELFRSAK